MRKFLTATGLCWVFVTASPAFLLTSPPALAQSASNDGQYVDLIRSYECRRDRKQYGSFHNYGYWKGGRWCGYRMPAGYYVYQDGVWYIWAAVNKGNNNQQGIADQGDAAVHLEER